MSGKALKHGVAVMAGLLLVLVMWAQLNTRLVASRSPDPIEAARFVVARYQQGMTNASFKVLATHNTATGQFVTILVFNGERALAHVSLKAFFWAGWQERGFEVLSLAEEARH